MGKWPRLIGSHSVNSVTDILSHPRPQKETNGQCRQLGLLIMKVPFLMPSA